MPPGLQVNSTPEPKGDFDLSGEALPHDVSHSLLAWQMFGLNFGIRVFVSL
jgi:hypothetical protein